MSHSKINSITAESISAIRQIKTFMLSKKILQELSRNLESLKIINLKNVLFQNSPRALIEILIYSGIIAAVLISYYRSTELLISLVQCLWWPLQKSKRNLMVLTLLV